MQQFSETKREILYINASEKGLVSKLYKEIIKSIYISKNWERKWIDISVRTDWWPIGTWIKMIIIFCHQGNSNQDDNKYHLTLVRMAYKTSIQAWGDVTKMNTSFTADGNGS